MAYPYPPQQLGYQQQSRYSSTHAGDFQGQQQITQGSAAPQAYFSSQHNGLNQNKKAPGGQNVFNGEANSLVPSATKGVHSSHSHVRTPNLNLNSSTTNCGYPVVTRHGISSPAAFQNHAHPVASGQQHLPPSQYNSFPSTTNQPIHPLENGPSVSLPRSLAMHESITNDNPQLRCKAPVPDLGPPLLGQQYNPSSSSRNSARNSFAHAMQGQSTYTSQSISSQDASGPLNSVNRWNVTPISTLSQPNLNQQITPSLPNTNDTSQHPSLELHPEQFARPPIPGQSWPPPPPLAPGQVHAPQAPNVRPPLHLDQSYPSRHQVAPLPLPGATSILGSHPQSLPFSETALSHPSAIPPLPGQSLSSLSQPPMPGQNTYPSATQNLSNNMANMAINAGQRPINLMQEQRILPGHKPVERPLKFDTSCDRGVLVPPNRENCSPDVLRCTLKALPHTQGLLNKVKLPLGLVLHPFKDLNSLPVISAGTIVRCRRCRTYVNPFVNFVDERRWRCNMCFVVNEVPEDFLHNPVTNTYGQPHTRPECTNSTVEYIAPQEYMLRPPQPAVYLFLLDVSHSAIETGYLPVVCETLLSNLDRLPGDGRTKIGFITYNQTIHFYRMNEGLALPQMFIVSDIDDVFIPTPDNLLANLRESKTLVQDLLHQLPSIHNLDVEGEMDTYSALGAALDVAKKLMAPFGGRVTVFQQSLPSIGPGKVEHREIPGNSSGDVPSTLLNPATDFYKKMALDCSANQVAIDYFFFNAKYIDIATLSCASRYSAGDLHYYPALHTVRNPLEAKRLRHDFERYLTRKIGFESVMRIRCTQGLGVHTFHGNFFVRSTDLLSLANVNPDSGFAVNLTIEDSLTELASACFQAALLYTTSKGERRIRVHTMCVPIVKTPSEVFSAIDSVAVASLLSKMGVDRSVTASISDAREALVNAVIDPIKAYKETLPQGMTTGGLYVPPCLRLFPLYVHCLLKHPVFRSSSAMSLDDRVFAMINFKMQPAAYLLQSIHPDLYRVDDLHEEGCIMESEREVPQPLLLPLSSSSLTPTGSFLLDCGWRMYLLVGRSTNRQFINDVLGYPQFSSIDEPMCSIPERENPTSELFQSFVEWLQDSRPHHAPIKVIRDDGKELHSFLSYLRQDRLESLKSFEEFLIHVKDSVNK